MTSSRALALGGLVLALATACGAFGAHALKGTLTPERLQLWETAVRYQFIHGLGLLAVGLTPGWRERGMLAAVAGLLVAGTLLFCGSLYALSLGAPRTLGMLTPLGGAAWLGAWLIYGVAMWRR